MKIKLLLSMVVMFFGSLTAAYASFPVQRATTNNQTTVSAANDDISSPAADGSGKSQVIALILVLLVGTLGIHRFYLGYTWQGVVQLLTFGGLGVWAIIDLIRIVTGDLKPKDGSYTKTL